MRSTFGPGLRVDALGGFAVAQRDQLAVVGHRQIAFHVLVILVVEVDIDVERLPLLPAGGGDELVHHHFMLDVILQGHHIDGHVLARSGRQRGVQIARGRVAVPDQQHPVHGIVPHRRQAQLQRSGGIRSGSARRAPPAPPAKATGWESRR